MDPAAAAAVAQLAPPAPTSSTPRETTAAVALGLTALPPPARCWRGPSRSCAARWAAISPPHSGEIPRADCSCQRSHQSASRTPPAALVLELPRSVSSSSSIPPLPLLYHTFSPFHKVTVILL